MITVARAVAVCLGCTAGLALAAPSATAATVVRTYSPLDADGTLRDGLVVERGGAPAECSSESYVAFDAVRCFAGNFIIGLGFDLERLTQRVLLLSLTTRDQGERPGQGQPRILVTAVRCLAKRRGGGLALPRLGEQELTAKVRIGETIAGAVRRVVHV